AGRSGTGVESCASSASTPNACARCVDDGESAQNRHSRARFSPVSSASDGGGWLPHPGCGCAPGRAMTRTAKYDAAAQGWGEERYADSAAYLRHRAELVVELGPKLESGDTVLDLACG